MSRPAEGMRTVEQLAAWELAGRRHLAWCRARGIAVPPGFRDQVLAFGFLAQLGTDGQPDPAACDPREGDHMTPLTLTKLEAAQYLGVSESTVKNLVAAGELPLVHIRGAARILRHDVEAYAASLRSPQVVTK